jgi:hypothetical protein
MSFLDNLENDLKALENREQGGIEDHDRRDEERKRARAAAPWAEKLKQSEWTSTLMRVATRAGYQRRTKVSLMWIGTTLRLEARVLRLELRPAADGVAAVFLDGREEIGRQSLDLAGDPQALVAEWMSLLDERKRMEEDRAPHGDFETGE